MLSHGPRLSLFVAVLAAFPIAAGAADTRSAATPALDVGRQIKLVQAEGAKLRRNADALIMMARTPLQHSKVAHTTQLEQARRSSNKVRSALGDLDAARAAAAPAQVAAIDRLLTRHRAAEAQVDAAIQHFVGRQSLLDLYAPAYQNALEQLYAEARAMAQPAAPPTAIAAD